MKILGVESSATSASVSVVENGKVIALESSNTGLTHSQTLMPMVESTLKKATATINDIDYIAVSNGPGSFTGIRIGVSLVKGLSDPLNKKCVEVSTLEAIAKPLENTGVIAVSVMDARCNQVYCALFDCGKDEMSRLTDDDAISIDELTEKLKNQEKKVVLIGDGANICYNKMKDVLILLKSGKKLPAKYKDHELKGDWKGFRELHISPDWLLIYTKNKTELILTLTRTGSHSELFKK